MFLKKVLFLLVNKNLEKVNFENNYLFEDFSLFPKDSESLTFLDIQLHEVWAKRLLNCTLKVNTHTQTHTDTHTQTNRLIESIGPEGR